MKDTSFNPKSIRPFLGAKDFNKSRSFYNDLGCKEVIISANMSYFSFDDFGFYLQDAYVKQWVDNTMVFLEVQSAEQIWEQLVALRLHEKYSRVKITAIKSYDWGKECFVHDPSGILWHFGEFNAK
jgi:catechol 2,3-dioxygenase-like lactoylglutathione lyase family enzyme